MHVTRASTESLVGGPGVGTSNKTLRDDADRKTVAENRRVRHSVRECFTGDARTNGTWGKSSSVTFTVTSPLRAARQPTAIPLKRRRPRGGNNDVAHEIHRPTRCVIVAAAAAAAARFHPPPTAFVRRYRRIKTTVLRRRKTLKIRRCSQLSLPSLLIGVGVVSFGTTTAWDFLIARFPVLRTLRPRPATTRCRVLLSRCENAVFTFFFFFFFLPTANPKIRFSTVFALPVTGTRMVFNSDCRNAVRNTYYAVQFTWHFYIDRTAIMRFMVALFSLFRFKNVRID